VNRCFEALAAPVLEPAIMRGSIELSLPWTEPTGDDEGGMSRAFAPGRAKGRAAEERVHPLSPGTRVGAWRAKAWQGQGGYGAVYRAERVGLRRSEPGALKVSLSAWNWRMEREVELLSRLNHPSIPRLLDRGGRRSPSRDEYPFFVMQWVQGMPLYAWAEQDAPSGPQLCRMVAQLARALEAVHAAGAVHRDVKGDNILVRLSDRLPVLIDFGSCHFAGAQRITWQSLPPVTPEYLPPQAVLFYLHSLHHPDGYYAPSPADDLYALGVTAYRLVMGQYPAVLRRDKTSKAAGRRRAQTSGSSWRATPGWSHRCGR
jgi:serine/threonine protein kinase